MEMEKDLEIKSKQLIDKLVGTDETSVKKNARFGFKIFGSVGSQNIIWSKYKMDRMIRTLDQTMLEKMVAEKNIEQQKNIIKEKTDRIEKLEKNQKKLEEEYKKIEAQHKRLLEQYYKFRKNQQKGMIKERVLTTPVKETIKEAWEQGYKLKDIHEGLVLSGIDISYEAIRKYVKVGKETGDWRISKEENKASASLAAEAIASVIDQRNKQQGNE